MSTDAKVTAALHRHGVYAPARARVQAKTARAAAADREGAGDATGAADLVKRAERLECCADIVVRAADELLRAAESIRADTPKSKAKFATFKIGRPPLAEGGQRRTGDGRR